MITEKDIRMLRKTANKRTRLLMDLFMGSVIVFWSVVAIFNVRVAAMYASFDGLSLQELIAAWVAGWDLYQEYAGVYCVAMERWCTALIQLATAYAFFLPMWLILRARSARAGRILQFIESTKSEQSPASDSDVAAPEE